MIGVWIEVKDGLGEVWLCDDSTCAVASFDTSAPNPLYTIAEAKVICGGVYKLKTIRKQ